MFLANFSQQAYDKTVKPPCLRDLCFNPSDTKFVVVAEDLYPKLFDTKSAQEERVFSCEFDFFMNYNSLHFNELHSPNFSSERLSFRDDI